MLTGSTRCSASASSPPTPSRSRLATGILLLPEHNPLVVAKQAATLDVLSGGRFVLGVGVGWSAEEFEALGVPFARRGARTDEYIAAMRPLWADESPRFQGEFVRFDSVRVNPQAGPRAARSRSSSAARRDAALRRVAAIARRLVRIQPVPAADVAGRADAAGRAVPPRAGRDMRDLDLAVSLSDAEPALLPELAAAGITELVIVGGAARPAPPRPQTGSTSSLLAQAGRALIAG